MIVKMLALGMVLIAVNVGASQEGREVSWADLSEEAEEARIRAEEDAAAALAEEKAKLEQMMFAGRSRRQASGHGKGHPDVRKNTLRARLQAKVGK